MARFCAVSRGLFKDRRFSPFWWSTVLMLACVALFIHLGQWQQGKAERKQAAQAQIDQRSHGGLISFPATQITSAVEQEALQYATVTVRGRFEPERQFLVDNRVYQEQAGYHVVTPLRIAGSDVRLLVNRGWIPAAANHRDIPAIATSKDEVELTGTAILPGNRFFTLGKEAATEQWQPLWQNLDMARFKAAVPYPVQPLIIQLDASSPAGFARDWPRPDERWEKHLSYALQWYGFAASAVLIWFYMGWRKT
jgi:surfeit locus 1 family protein